jgi:hypothetical protein
MTNPNQPVGRFPLSVDGTDFLTFERIPEDLRRSIVPLVEMTRTDDGSADIRPIGTAFVISELPSGQALLVTANHNVDQWAGNLLILLPKPGEDPDHPALQGLIVSGVSKPESGLDVALITTAIDDSVVTPQLIPLSIEIPQVDGNCLALGYSELVVGEPIDLEATAEIRLSSSRGKIEEVHPSRRDQRIDFPSFRTDALRVRHERGPVISVRGGAVGVVSSCMESTEDGVPHTSYVALSASLFLVAIPEEGSEAQNLADLVDDRRVIVSGVSTTVYRSKEGVVTVAWSDVSEPPT